MTPCGQATAARGQKRPGRRQQLQPDGIASWHPIRSCTAGRCRRRGPWMSHCLLVRSSCHVGVEEQHESFVGRQRFRKRWRGSAVRCLHHRRVRAVCGNHFLDDVGFGFPPLLPQSHLSRVRQLLAGESLVEQLGHVAAPGWGGDEGEGSRHLRRSSAAIHRVVLPRSWRCQDRHWNRFEKPDCMFVEHLREDPSNSWSIPASMHPLPVIKKDVPDDRSVRHTSRRNRKTQELDTSLQCLVRHQGTGSQHRLQKLPTGGGRHLIEWI